MGDTIPKGASHVFKKAHDGFEAWVNRMNGWKVDGADRYIMPLFTVAVFGSLGYEFASAILNSQFDLNIPTMASKFQP